MLITGMMLWRSGLKLSIQYSIRSDLQPPMSAAVIDDAGEGTSSGAENWPRDEDDEMHEEYQHMVSLRFP